MKVVANILTQSLLIILTMIAYQAYFRHRVTTARVRKVIFIFMCLIGVVASFYYPISIEDGYKIDLRIIPFILAFTYGGFASGITVALFILGITYWLSLVGFKIDLFIFTLLIPFFYFTYKKYRNYTFKQKLVYLFSTLFAFCIMTIIGVEFIPIDHPDGLIIWLIFVAINAVTLFVVVYMKESMHELEIMNIALQDKEKMTVVGELAATLIHEVKNPLTTINGFLQILSHSERLSEKERSYIAISLKELNQANAIISDYLSIAKSKKDTNWQLLKINEEIRHIKELVNGLAMARSVDIYVNIMDEELVVKGSQSELRQVFTNIVKNAVEAIEGHHGIISIHSYQTLDFVVVEIKDNGKGMSKDQLKNLGQTFYTTKSNGTGLGMMVSKRIVQWCGWDNRCEK